MKKFIIVTLCVFSIISCSCKKDKNGGGDQEPEENTVDVTYEASNEIFPNPERGFYRYTDTNLGSSPRMLSESTLKGYRNSNYTLIYRIFYLKEFRDKALSEQALSQFDTDMNTLRKSGLKCILRFAYSSREDEPDAPLDIILQHLDQLKPYLEQHVDVIALMQAGLIGAWGEWYYSSNNLKTPAIRATLLDKILEVLPVTRMVQVRTPAYKTNYVQRTTALAQNEAFSGSKAARVGHHNDCFMASTTDYGTYQDAVKEKEYLNKDGLYVPVGGETCPPSGVDPADCAKAESEMRNLRWNFLNEDYYKGVNDRWKTQGCMDNIIKELGYRFVLMSGTYPVSLSPGSACKLKIELKNVGYSCLYNPRPLEFVLKNSATGDVYVAQSDIDPRFWKPLVVSTLELSLGIPSDMPAGDYDLYLNLPDAGALISSNPDYSVQLANKNVWDATTGFNNLNHKISIGDFKATPYEGELYFKSKN